MKSKFASSALFFAVFFIFQTQAEARGGFLSRIFGGRSSCSGGSCRTGGCTSCGTGRTSCSTCGNQSTCSTCGNNGSSCSCGTNNGGSCSCGMPGCNGSSCSTGGVAAGGSSHEPATAPSTAATGATRELAQDTESMGIQIDGAPDGPMSIPDSVGEDKALAHLKIKGGFIYGQGEDGKWYQVRMLKPSGKALGALEGTETASVVLSKETRAELRAMKDAFEELKAGPMWVAFENYYWPQSKAFGVTPSTVASAEPAAMSAERENVPMPVTDIDPLPSHKGGIPATLASMTTDTTATGAVSETKPSEPARAVAEETRVTPEQALSEIQAALASKDKMKISAAWTNIWSQMVQDTEAHGLEIEKIADLGQRKEAAKLKQAVIEKGFKDLIIPVIAGLKKGDDESKHFAGVLEEAAGVYLKGFQEAQTEPLEKKLLSDGKDGLGLKCVACSLGNAVPFNRLLMAEDPQIKKPETVAVKQPEPVKPAEIPAMIQVAIQHGLAVGGESAAAAQSMQNPKAGDHFAVVFGNLGGCGPCNYVSGQFKKYPQIKVVDINILQNPQMESKLPQYNLKGSFPFVHYFSYDGTKFVEGRSRKGSPAQNDPVWSADNWAPRTGAVAQQPSSNPTSSGSTVASAGGARRVGIRRGR
ncbi:hypothetical protein K2X33_04190 [bacterium]|nr:hypothetical protein [bacterium]